VVRYPQTEKWETSESAKKAHSTRAISRNKQHLTAQRIFYSNFTGSISHGSQRRAGRSLWM